MLTVSTLLKSLSMTKKLKDVVCYLSMTSNIGNYRVPYYLFNAPQESFLYVKKIFLSFH